MEPQSVNELYDYLYAECPPGLAEQREQARLRQQRREQRGADHD